MAKIRLTVNDKAVPVLGPIRIDVEDFDPDRPGLVYSVTFKDPGVVTTMLLDGIPYSRENELYTDVALPPLCECGTEIASLNGNGSPAGIICGGCQQLFCHDCFTGDPDDRCNAHSS